MPLTASVCMPREEGGRVCFGQTSYQGTLLPLGFSPYSHTVRSTLACSPCPWCGHFRGHPGAPNPSHVMDTQGEAVVFGSHRIRLGVCPLGRAHGSGQCVGSVFFFYAPMFGWEHHPLKHLTPIVLPGAGGSECCGPCPLPPSWGRCGVPCV